MKFKEYLKTKREGDLIKVGFKNGTSYSYTGPVFERLYDILMDLSCAQKRKYEEMFKNAERKMKGYKVAEDISKRMVPLIALELKKYEKDADKEFPKDLEKRLYEIAEECRIKERENTRAKYDQSRIELSRRPYDIFNREVVETFPSIDESGVENVIVDGCWVGEFWSVSGGVKSLKKKGFLPDDYNCKQQNKNK